jgi:hypothetical protein
MLRVGETICLSAGDFVGHLNCRYFTELDLKVANGDLEKPRVWGPVLATIAERGANPDVLKGFRTHVRSANWRRRDLLRNRDFIERLQNPANVRNDSAHVNEPSADKIVSAISIVADQGRRGDIFRAVGIDTPDLSPREQSYPTYTRHLNHDPIYRIGVER